MKPFVPKSMLLSIILTLLSVIHGQATLNPDAYNFSYLTADHGMAQNTVDYIYKDSRGFIWFATWNGLNRFDGYEFVRYGTQPGSDALSSLFVRTLVEDHYQHLWVGTETGIDRIDLLSGHVIHPEGAEWKSNPVFSTPVNALICDKEGRIWIGQEDGLTIVTLNKAGKIASVDRLCEGEDAFVCSLCEAPDGTIWVGYRNGLIQTVSRLSEKAFQFADAPAALLGQSYNEVFTILADGDDRWFGTSKGLAYYNIRTSAYHFYTNRPGDPHSLIQDYIKDLVLDSEGNLIIATYKGICIYNKEMDNFLQITSRPDQKGGLNNNFVNSLYAEPSGTIWIGTEKGGVNKMIKKEVMFEFYQHNNKQPISLSPNPVNAICEDSRGTLWIGTVEGGLNERKAGSTVFNHYNYQDGNPHSLSHNTVSFLTEGAGALWVGTWGGGLNRMELGKSGHFTTVGQQVGKGELSSYFIASIIYDESLNGLWVGSPAGLDFYDLSNQVVFPVLNKAEEENQISTVSGLCLDSQRRLWIGTELGLYCIDLNQTNLPAGKVSSKRYWLSAEGKQNPRNEKINCIVESADHTIWLGTYGNGLYKRISGDTDEATRFKCYGTESGLSDNVIYAIQEDNQGALWLSTNRGLSCFSPQKESASTFYTSDGLPNNQFYWTAVCRTAEGKILFGHVDGAIEFNPKEIRPDSSALSVSIVGGHLYNEPVVPPVAPEVWKINEQDKSVSLTFSALYYVSPEKIRYAYKLDGFDTDWTEVDSNRRFANYTNLPAGKYIFKVKCTNPDGEWSDRITELEIRIIPPFYKEKWFLFTLIAIFILSLYYFNEMRIRNLRRQKQKLELLVEERTEKIKNQKDRLATQARDLEDTLAKLMTHQTEISKQNEQLIQQNIEISHQKEQLEILSSQLHQATQDKINFFTNITHEFKTPLTLILGPIEQALKLSQNPKVQEQLALVRKNSKFLLSLINQLMDFRKADSGNLKVKKTTGNFMDFIQAIVPPFYSLVKAREVQILDYEHIPFPNFRFDPDLMQKVLVNLLSNAVKFTPDHGSICLYIAQLPHTDKSKWLYISVNDTGSGIPEESQELIFDRFYQVDNTDVYPVFGQSGTGIGLYLCRQIILLLGGRIWVKNNRSGGASFRMLLPLLAEDLAYKESHELYDSPELYARSAEIEKDGEQIDRDKPLLLIVEDNSDMRAFIRSILDDKFSILEASNGESGLAKTLKYEPDFILSDIMMPVMDGLEFTRKVKNNFAISHIPILLLTAKNSTDVRIEGYKSGADGYIAKPFDAELLLARITNMIESRNRLHEAFENSMDIKSLNIEEASQDRLFLDQLMTVIEDNFTDPDFDVTDLIDKMHISKSLLGKKLQSLLGQSAVKVIRSYRLNKAKELIEKLGNGQMNISEIAYAVGFNDPKYFTRCFTKAYGTSPSGYLENGS